MHGRGSNLLSARGKAKVDNGSKPVAQEVVYTVARPKSAQFFRTQQQRQESLTRRREGYHDDMLLWLQKRGKDYPSAVVSALRRTRRLAFAAIGEMGGRKSDRAMFRVERDRLCTCVQAKSTSAFRAQLRCLFGGCASG